MVWGYFPMKWFCGIFPLKKVMSSNSNLKFQRCQCARCGSRPVKKGLYWSCEKTDQCCTPWKSNMNDQAVNRDYLLN
jgi:hypothetical protein